MWPVAPFQSVVPRLYPQSDCVSIFTTSLTGRHIQRSANPCIKVAKLSELSACQFPQARWIKKGLKQTCCCFVCDLIVQHYNLFMCSSTFQTKPANIPQLLPYKCCLRDCKHTCSTSSSSSVKERSAICVAVIKHLSRGSFEAHYRLVDLAYIAHVYFPFDHPSYTRPAGQHSVVAL